jgi:ATP-dependent Clp protease ATP-binding subunit ClpA
LDSLFSRELKELISQSRETAIDLGYDYITTIHFFIADCETKSNNSIFRFGFKSDEEYQNFKKHYTLKSEDLLTLEIESLPLTKEAEVAIRLARIEADQRQQALIYPAHLFIGALKNKGSLLTECFKQDENALEKLISYYEQLGEFEKDKKAGQPVSDGFLKKISKLWRK